MTLTQTINVPTNRRVTLPCEVPTGPVIIAFTPVTEIAAADNCPLCAKYRDPKSGALRPNDETIAAIEESRKSSAKQFNSLEELLIDLRS